MKSAGFSLIEVLVAMALVLILVLGTAELIALSLAAKRTGDQASGLARAAAEKLEQLKSVPFDGPELEPGGRIENVVNESGRAVFVRSWEVEETGDGMKSVRIRVHPRGRPRSAVVLTLFICRDLGFAP